MFVLLPLSGTASQLQGHIHWVLEFAIDIISTTAKGDITMVTHFCKTFCKMFMQPPPPPQKVPDVSTLLELRMTLLLVHVLNKCLPVPIVPVSGKLLTIIPLYWLGPLYPTMPPNPSPHKMECCRCSSG